MAQESVATQDNGLADFLRTRRRSLSPEALGLDTGGDRRVDGLRREEVAKLAAVSADYYRRLEQGRERHPSRQVLEALARALRLDDHASRHLFEMVMPAPQITETSSSRQVSAGVRLLIDHSLRAPASVIGPASDVLALNLLAATLYSPFSRVDNLAMMVFLDSAAQDFYPDWETVARTSVASLRAASTSFPRESRVAEVVGELCVESNYFATLWAEHEVSPRVESDHVFYHPVAGELHVKFEALSISGAAGQRIYVYTPVPGSPGAQMLDELAERACEDEEPDTDPAASADPSRPRFTPVSSLHTTASRRNG